MLISPGSFFMNKYDVWLLMYSSSSKSLIYSRCLETSNMFDLNKIAIHPMCSSLPLASYHRIDDGTFPHRSSQPACTAHGFLRLKLAVPEGGKRGPNDSSCNDWHNEFIMGTPLGDCTQCFFSGMDMF